MEPVENHGEAFLLVSFVEEESPAAEAGLENLNIDPLDFKSLADFAVQENIGLTIVGPEAPLVAGIVDYFQERQLTIFGPSRNAAQLEGSKSFTKDFLARHHIPTAAYQTFTELNPALNYIDIQGAPIVIKADGLAEGRAYIKAYVEFIHFVERLYDSTMQAPRGHFDERESPSKNH